MLMRKMKKSSRSLLLFAIASVSALPVFSETSGGGNAHRVSIETIRDLNLSGYNEDDAGDLQWRLEAETAEADPQTKTEDIKRALWALNKLKLSTFGGNGEVFAEMTSPEGRFNPEKREADSDARVEVKGEIFTVRGRGWSWTGRGHDNLIRVHDSVFVSISLPDKDAPLTVVSKRLSVRGTAEQTLLTFSGEVKVSYGDIYMTGDTLEIVVPESGGNARRSVGGSGKKIGELDSVRSITGRGNVSISRGAMRLEGDAAEFLPQEDRFHVRGNARLTELTGQLAVRGDEASGKIKERFVEILATRPNGALPDSPVAVSVEMPSFVDRGNASADGGGRTVVSGKRMTVSSTDDENVISLFGEVVAADRDIRIEADTLVVSADATAGDALISASVDEAGGNDGDDLRKIRAVSAAGNVRVDYSGRLLYCDRADVFPQKNFILLTGTPKVVSQDEGATLSGDRAEIFLDRDLIEVFSEDGNAPERRRVVVELPAFSGKTEKKSGVPAFANAARTDISGEHLTLRRDDDLSTFDIFGNVLMKSEDIDGSCDRLVVFADSKPQEKRAAREKNDLSQIKKIIAEGNVRLEQNGYELTGGRASITPAVGLKEWVEDEEKVSDGNAPFLVSVEPDTETGTRPRILFPGGESGTALEFALPSQTRAAGKKENGADAAAARSSDELPLSKKKKPSAEKPESSAPAKKSYLESDSMELIAGERRARFFLRGDVIFSTDGGAHGMCDSVEGLLAPRSRDDSNFEAKKVICRGSVRLVHEESTARGSTLEVFPPENRAALSGNAHFRDKDGVELFPGNDRFVFDLEKRQLITTVAVEDGNAVPAQVSRPQIIIPKGSDRVFVVPKSVRGKSGGESGGKK